MYARRGSLLMNVTNARRGERLLLIIFPIGLLFAVSVLAFSLYEYIKTPSPFGL